MLTAVPGPWFLARRNLEHLRKQVATVEAFKLALHKMMKNGPQDLRRNFAVAIPMRQRDCAGWRQDPANSINLPNCASRCATILELDQMSMACSCWCNTEVLHQQHLQQLVTVASSGCGVVRHRKIASLALQIPARMVRKFDERSGLHQLVDGGVVPRQLADPANPSEYHEPHQSAQRGTGP